MKAPAGAVVGLYVDTKTMTLEPGDVVRTGTGRSYEVLEARVQQRGKWAGIRQHLRVLVLPDGYRLAPGQRMLRIWWYRR